MGWNVVLMETRYDSAWSSMDGHSFFNEHQFKIYPRTSSVTLFREECIEIAIVTRKIRFFLCYGFYGPVHKPSPMYYESSLKYILLRKHHFLVISYRLIMGRRKLYYYYN